MKNKANTEETPNPKENISKEVNEENLLADMAPSNYSQEMLMATLANNIGEMVMEYQKMRSESMKHEKERDYQIETKELEIVDKIDSRDKVYKGILISVSIIALVVSVIFLESDKSAVLIPVLSLIIGLLFKSNPMSDFISFRKKSTVVNNDE